MTSEICVPQPVNDDEIDLRELILALWQKKWWIIACTVLAAALAIVVAMRAPRVYESTVLLIPTSTDASSSSTLGAAAALLGKKSGGTGDLDLYQGLMNSRTVIHQLLMTDVRDWSDSGRGRMLPLWRVMRVDLKKRGAMDMAARGLLKSIEVAPNGTGEGGIIEVKVSAGQPWLAQQIANIVVDLAQEEIRRVRSERYNIILSRLERASSGARSDWNASSQQLAGYQDVNRSITLPEQQLDVDRMSTEKQVRQDKYLLVRNTVEQMRVERAKAVPPMVVLDPADYPYVPAKPKRKLIVLAGMMLGFLGSCAGVLLWKAIFAPLPVTAPRPDQIPAR